MVRRRRRQAAEKIEKEKQAEERAKKEEEVRKRRTQEAEKREHDKNFAKRWEDAQAKYEKEDNRKGEVANRNYLNLGSGCLLSRCQRRTVDVRGDLRTSMSSTGGRQKQGRRLVGAALGISPSTSTSTRYRTTPDANAVPASISTPTSTATGSRTPVAPSVNAVPASISPENSLSLTPVKRLPRLRLDPMDENLAVAVEVS